MKATGPASALDDSGKDGGRGIFGGGDGESSGGSGVCVGEEFVELVGEVGSGRGSTTLTVRVADNGRLLGWVAMGRVVDRR